MGVYHLMGLGLSPGAVTGPLTYLAHRYQRWNADDQRFFARSGEVEQRTTGERVGDVQALVLFTTSEVLRGEVAAHSYVDNSPGRIATGPEKPRAPMKTMLPQLLRKVLPQIAGERPTTDLFWCEIDRRNIGSTYERVAQIISALANVGGQGKELWVNLTGGNNITNFALELASTLSGQVARLYYVQAANSEAEKCVRFTTETGYWVELPLMPLALGRLSQTIIDLLTNRSPLSQNEIYGILHNEYWDLSRGLNSVEILREEYLVPLWKQGLITGASDGYFVGPEWDLIRPYQEILEKARNNTLTIEKIAQTQSWLEREVLSF